MSWYLVYRRRFVDFAATLYSLAAFALVALKSV